jgi:hypothetical protein
MYPVVVNFSSGRRRSGSYPISLRDSPVTTAAVVCGDEIVLVTESLL